jgi:hypothetical protein
MSDPIHTCRHCGNEACCPRALDRSTLIATAAIGWGLAGFFVIATAFMMLVAMAEPPC